MIVEFARIHNKWYWTVLDKTSVIAVSLTGYSCKANAVKAFKRIQKIK